MTYLALARKWRPRTFEDVVGQPHVVRALTNALTSGRVHHAFLFAGTRGVGKTTVARIFARCLNCEAGVSASPCGECRACLAIDEGRFVDLIEVDAASRTGVDDMRDLLDNVQYTPATGRYKVYLIDEVHMLSKPAFNALLKTLEEPPPHVKFLFATTDPQKLPVTVLSRCLQFNLKRLPAGLIVARMAAICTAEGVTAETGALARLARAAAGSMRDGLSLLDQALAFGDGALRDADVAEMLGSLDRGRVLSILDAVAAGQAAALLEKVRELDELVPDYLGLLDDVATALQKIAVLQLAGEDALDDDDDADGLRGLAARLDPELTQLCYQIAIISRRDLPLAPEPRLGFEMAMLRMLAFTPRRTEVAATAAQPAQAVQPAQGPPRPDDKGSALSSPGDWAAFVPGLGLEGAARQLAMHAQCTRVAGNDVWLSIDRASTYLVTDQLRARLVAALQARLGPTARVQIEVGLESGDTPAGREQVRQGEALQRARAALETDPNVREMTSLFGAQIVNDSVKPADNNSKQKS